jgi:hypothetical protein
MIINSAATCSKRYEEPYNGLDISFDKALNKSLPSGITLKGITENFVETADDAHTILVGTPIVLNPPTKADDL